MRTDGWQNIAGGGTGSEQNYTPRRWDWKSVWLAQLAHPSRAELGSQYRGKNTLKIVPKPVLVHNCLGDRLGWKARDRSFRGLWSGGPGHRGCSSCPSVEVKRQMYVDPAAAARAPPLETRTRALQPGCFFFFFFFLTVPLRGHVPPLGPSNGLVKLALTNWPKTSYLVALSLCVGTEVNFDSYPGHRATPTGHRPTHTPKTKPPPGHLCPRFGPL